MAYDTPITTTVSTPQPPPPQNNPPSDWSNVVHANYFSNIERLGRWMGGTSPVTTGTVPADYFNPVTVSSLGAVDLGVVPWNIYVLVHGWAPGYSGQVPADGDIFWWSTSAAVANVWPSSWAWQSLIIDNGKFTVNSTGMLQSIAQMDPNATLLCYSWLDDSATIDSNIDPQDYQSEANTHINGIRLANALLEAINLTFFLNGGSIHLIGHSHGSKVCTVAALRLQAAGFPAARLTILDSPEWEPTLVDNGANLLGSYVQGLNIMDPANPSAGGIFVENCASFFDVMFAQDSSSIVGVCLNPAGNGGLPSITDSHSYAAGWYGASASSSPAVGLAWTAPPPTYKPVFLQGSFTSTASQFTLSQGNSTFDTYSYATQPLTDGNGNSIPNLVLNASNNQTTVTFDSDNADQYGIAFDVDWTSPQVGDYLVASVTGDFTYTVLVLDGQSAPIGTTTVFVNADVDDFSGTANLTVYFVAGTGNTTGDQVTLSNFQWVGVTKV